MVRRDRLQGRLLDFRGIDSGGFQQVGGRPFQHSSHNFFSRAKMIPCRNVRSTPVACAANPQSGIFVVTWGSGGFGVVGKYVRLLGSC